MRHRVAHRKLGRVTEHRIAMLRNQATSLLRHEHLTTTVPRAKELRPFVERLITIAKRGGANGKTLHARRLLMHDLQDQEVIEQAVRHAGAALRVAAGRLHAPAAPRIPPRRQRRGRAGRARRQRVRPAREGEGRREGRGGQDQSRPASVDGCGRSPSASAARREASASEEKPAKRGREDEEGAGRRRNSDNAPIQRRVNGAAGHGPSRAPRGCATAGAFVSQTSSTSTPARSAFAAAMIFACRCAGTSS